jgi:Asp-tRNA(Asn)/Glu-tRNA(Gln) amidotransferase B subunit
MSNSNKLAKAVTAKFAESDFQRLRLASERTGKRPAEWCRERVLENLNGIRPSPAQCAILAEILALQDTLVGLICALGREGRLTPQKAKEIVDAAHERKYRDVAALFKDAEAECRRSAR